MAIWRVPVRIEHSSMPDPGFNIFHVRGINNDRDLLLEAVDSLHALYFAMKQLYPSGTTIVLGEGMRSNIDTEPLYVADARRTIAGTGGGGPAPALLAISAGWRTAVATRSGRGRTFFGPVAAEVLDNGKPKAAFVNSLQAACDDLVSASTGPSGWSFGVWSVKQNILRDFTGVNVREDSFAYLSSRRD